MVYLWEINKLNVLEPFGVLKGACEDMDPVEMNRPDKIIVNLSDINKTGVFTQHLPDNILLLYKVRHTKATMFMVYNAQSVAQRNNDDLGVYPNPKTKIRPLGI